MQDEDEALPLEYINCANVHVHAHIHTTNMQGYMQRAKLTHLQYRYNELNFSQL